MKTGFRRMVGIFLGALVIVMLAGVLPVSADGQGQLTLSFRYDNQPLQGVSFQAYLVALLNASASDATYTPVSPFTKNRKGQAVSYAGLTTEQSIDLASWFSALTSRAQNGISGTADASGEAVITGLQNGMYLIVQTDRQNADGTFSPFLVSVPRGVRNAGGYSWSYSVMVEPKYEEKNAAPPTATTTITPGGNGGTTGNPKKTTTVKTGDMSNGLLYLSLLGISMAVLILLFRRRDIRRR